MSAENLAKTTFGLKIIAQMSANIKTIVVDLPNGNVFNGEIINDLYSIIHDWDGIRYEYNYKEYGFQNTNSPLHIELYQKFMKDFLELIQKYNYQIVYGNRDMMIVQWR